MKLVCSGKHCHAGPFASIKALDGHESTCAAAKSANNVEKILKRARKEERREKKADKKRKKNAVDGLGSRSENASVGPSGHSSECDAATATGNDADTFANDDIREPSALEQLALRSVRSGRRVRLPAQYTDFLPTDYTPLRHMPLSRRQELAQMRSDPATAPAHSSPSPEPVNVPEEPQDTRVTTEPNEYGLYRIYPQQPTLDPLETESLDSVCDAPTLLVPPTRDDGPPVAGPPRPPRGIDLETGAPFSNISSAFLMEWQNTGGTAKSAAEVDRLARDILQRDGFVTEDVARFSHAKESRLLDQHLEHFHKDDGWIEATVTLRLPCEGVKHPSEADAPIYEVEGLQYRKLFNIIKDTFESPASCKFHMTPFELYWKSEDPSEPDQRVYSEIYNSSAMLEAHADIQKIKLSAEDGPDVERVVVAMMEGSDASHLAQFGTASLWPVYTLVGNESKYTLLKPTSGSCHHTAYVPKLSDDFQDQYKTAYGKPPSAAVLTHCKRELMHGVWKILLDEDFMHAYEHGMVVRCGDGVLRRLFPRFFTYAADYPEKVLLASIKYLGACPCPRCLVKKENIQKMGTVNHLKFRQKHPRLDTEWHAKAVDEVRKLIFEQGVPFTSVRVERKLEYSTVPTRNAFSRVLAPLGANFYRMFVPDLLHEFDLGVWKAIFVHLMRLLYAIGGDGIQDLNERYRNVPSFGRDTIRRFHENASGMKKLAARDFEDLLQCALPVFEGLFPGRHGTIVSDMLFDLAAWQAYAKSRLHTEKTLEYFATTTTSLGKSVRRFMGDTCKVYATFELPQETGARGRRTAALAAKGKGPSTVRTSKKFKSLNFSSSKAHSLPDFPAMVPVFGTNEIYSTQRTELEHRYGKRWYSRTNKHNWARQIANHERRARFMADVSTQWKKAELRAHARKARRRRLLDCNPDPLPKTAPDQHYHISNATKSWVNMTKFCAEHSGDPAIEDFVKNLHNHLLGRLTGQQFDDHAQSYDAQDRDTVQIRDGKLFLHRSMRINYTSYDVRRGQDPINPRCRADIMVLAGEYDKARTGHPFCYARIIHIYHMWVRHVGPASISNEWRRMDVCFVRWFEFNAAVVSGWAARRLPCIGFVPAESTDPLPFGFLDPDQIVRAIHLIPRFLLGRTNALLPRSLSIARHPREEGRDWKQLYVGIFVDRDMVMRYRGGGIGHRATRRNDTDFAKDAQSEGASESDEEQDEPMDGNLEGEAVARDAVEPEVPLSEEMGMESDADDGDDVEDEDGDDEWIDEDSDEDVDGSGDEDEDIFEEAGFDGY